MAGGGLSDGANVRATTQIEVLNAIVAKIQANVDALSTEPCCFISDTEMPSIELQENLFATVSIADGSFDVLLMDGGGPVQVCELSTVRVSVFSRIELDQLERFLEGLTDPDRGLLSIKHQLLLALAGKNLLGSDNALLLLESLSPSRSVHPINKEYDEFAKFSLMFDCKFNWDLGPNADLT